jgi:hypothetical protein
MAARQPLPSRRIVPPSAPTLMTPD